MNKKIRTSIAFLIVAILAFFLVGIVWYLSKGINVENKAVINIPNKKNESRIKIPEKGNVVCTQEMKTCPDGSLVARSGPNCEFAPCSVENEAVGIANPASVFCEENRGTLEIRTGEDGGQIGFCKFPDGSECEEWSYMRGECNVVNDQEGMDISNWQTYRNEELGFEIKYPKDFAKEADLKKNENESSNVCFSSQKEDPHGSNGFCIYVNNDKFNIDKFEVTLHGKVYNKKYNLESITIDNNLAYTYTHTHGLSTTKVILPKENLTYYMEYGFCGGCTDYVGRHWNKILSTFKFIN